MESIHDEREKVFVCETITSIIMSENRFFSLFFLLTFIFLFVSCASLKFCISYSPKKSSKPVLFKINKKRKERKDWMYIKNGGLWNRLKFFFFKLRKHDMSRLCNQVECNFSYACSLCLTVSPEILIKPRKNGYIITAQ